MMPFPVYLPRDRDTRNDGVTATSSHRGTLPVPPSLFSKSKKPESSPGSTSSTDAGNGTPVTPIQKSSYHEGGLLLVHSIKELVFL
jgi:hypothetical protein